MGLLSENPSELQELFMREALREAEKALERNEVPVGCVIVKQGRIIGRGHNQREMLQDSTAHAEMIAISAACQNVGSWRLEECEMFVTLEPCLMCAGAIVLARIPRLVYGAADPKAGACGSIYDVVRDPRLNHTVNVTAGVMSEASGSLLQEFFRTLRDRNQSAEV
jgi:tRNA(adenine34) deaminase